MAILQPRNCTTEAEAARTAVADVAGMALADAASMGTMNVGWRTIIWAVWQRWKCDQSCRTTTKPLDVSGKARNCRSRGTRRVQARALWRISSSTYGPKPAGTGL